MGTSVDFHDIVDVQVKRVNKYKATFGDGDWYTIHLHIVDARDAFHQLTIYTEKAEVVEQLSNPQLTINEVA